MPKERDLSVPFAEALATKRQAMLAIMADEGLTQAQYAMEVVAVARMAALDGDYSASFKGYELVGKALGVFAPETHQHLHLHKGDHASLAQASDAQLEAIIARAKEVAAIDVSARPRLEDTFSNAPLPIDVPVDGGAQASKLLEAMCS